MEFNDLKGLFGVVKTRMDVSIERVRKDLANVRTGRASVGMLDGIHVEAYGSKMPLNQVAVLSIPEPALMVAQPFDPSLLAVIEKAIRTSDLSLNPQSDGKVIRIPIPSLTEERRKEYIKLAKSKGEHAKVSIRNIRRAVKEALEKLEKDGEISKDDLARAEKELEKVTGDHVAKIDELLKHKEAELLEV